MAEETITEIDGVDERKEHLLTKICLVVDLKTRLYQCRWYYHNHEHTGPWKKTKRAAVKTAAEYWA